MNSLLQEVYYVDDDDKPNNAAVAKATMTRSKANHKLSTFMAKLEVFKFKFLIALFYWIYLNFFPRFLK